MKTAMQELIEFVNTRCLNGDFVLEKANQLLEKEKEQIMNSYVEGRLCSYNDNPSIKANEYYNQTYNI